MMNWIIGLVIAAVVVVGGGYTLMSGGYSMEEGGVTVATGDINGDGTGDAAEQEADAVADKKTKPTQIDSYSFGANNAGSGMTGTGGKAAPFTGSWMDLVKRGGTYVCEVDHSSAVDISSGMVYVSGTDVRGDFSSKTAAGVVESSMLKKGDMVYVWGGGMPQGVKMQATMMEGSSGASTGTSGQAVDAKQEYGWNCTPTAPDASKFVVPKTIEFMDVSAMMQGMGTIPGTR